MPNLKASEICYLLAFPDRVEDSSGPLEEIRGLKDAPYFQPVDIRVRTLAEGAEVEAGGARASILRQRYDDRIQLVDSRFQLPNALAMEAIKQREAIERNLRERLVPADVIASGMYEEYSILLLQGVRNSPDRFIARNALALARFIRSQWQVLDRQEIVEILQSRVRYSERDLTLVDWEGAVILAHDGDFQSDVELLKIGNYQLLRYRMLDESLDESLRAIDEQFRNPRRGRLQMAPTRLQFRRLVQHRLDLMLDFEHTDQNLLLIGDWYTAKLYHAIRDEFYLQEWRNAVHGKLDNLQGIMQTIQENFSLSWQALLETVQITGWLILLVGYFILFFIESGIAK